MKNLLAGIVNSALLIIAMSPAAHAADSPDAILKLLNDAQAQSSQLSLEWKSCTRQPPIAWSDDAAAVTLMKGDVAAVDRTVAALNEVRSQASPSQVAAMDRIVPVVREIAESTTRAIAFLSRNQARLTGKQYKDYVEQSSDTSSRLATLVSQMVDFEGRRARFDLAKRNLELAAR